MQNAFPFLLHCLCKIFLHFYDNAYAKCSSISVTLPETKGLSIFIALPMPKAIPNICIKSNKRLNAHLFISQRVNKINTPPFVMHFYAKFPSLAVTLLVLNVLHSYHVTCAKFPYISILLPTPDAPERLSHYLYHLPFHFSYFHTLRRAAPRPRTEPRSKGMTTERGMGPKWLHGQRSRTRY